MASDDLDYEREAAEVIELDKRFKHGLVMDRTLNMVAVAVPNG
jgi:hypothetical protein